MRRFITALSFLGLSLTLSTPGFAQRTTGGVSGTVHDGTGGVLPGVSVAVSGENIVGTQTAVTNENGLYRIIGLPPGSYDLVFSLSGFDAVPRRVRIAVGATTEENVSMGMSGRTETLLVIAEAPVVDTSSNEVGTNYDRDWVENAPTRRFSFFDLVASAPGSLQGGDSGFSAARTMVYGSSYDENSFQLDGIDITDNFFNEALAEPNMDAIEEIEVLSLGAPAEYGNLQGAVYNIVTRQGTNQWHGDLNFFTQTAGLTSTNTTEEQDDGFAYEREAYYDFTVQLGGPIVKDKLWFFGSYQLQRDEFSPERVDPALGFNDDKTDRFFGKVNWQLSPSHKVVFTYHQDNQDDASPPGPQDTPSRATKRTGKTPTPGVAYTGVLSDKTVLDVRYSGFYGDVSFGPRDPNQPNNLPWVYNLDTGESSGGWYYFYELQPKRTSFSAKVSHLADDFLGASHDFRFGVQYGTAEAGGVYGLNDFVYAYEYAGTSYGYGYTRQPFSYSGNTRSLGLFADDNVRVNDRLSVNLGVRYDNNRAFSRAQDELDTSLNPTGVRFPEVEHYTWTPISPRFGFNLKLTEDGKTVLKGHWGRYHRANATGEFANVIGPSIKPFFFGFYDFASASFFDLEQTSDNANLLVDPNYQAPRTDQFIVSLERQLARNVGLQANYVYKRGRNGPAWQDIGGVYAPATYVDDEGEGATGQSIQLLQLQNDRSDQVFQISNPVEMQTDIHAATLSLVKRMADNWQLTASATWLRSTGRTPDSTGTASALQRGGLQFRTFGRDPNDFVNSGGSLRGDVTWQAKAQFIYRLPADFLVSANYRFRSGAPLVRRARGSSVSAVTNLPSVILVQERGDVGRLPKAHSLDVRVQKDFRLGETARVALFVDALNLLNEDAYETVDSSFVTSSAFNVPDSFLVPRRLMLGAKLRF